MNPKCGIIIATRDRAGELKETLSQLRRLEPGPDEILICADGCMDSTAVMVRECFPECRLIENLKPQGSIPSRDALLRAATSEIIVSLDDDSYPLDIDFIPRVKAAFADRPKTAVLSFAELRNRGEWAGNKAPDLPCHPLAAYANCAAGMRRSVYLMTEGFPTIYGHMYEEPDYALQCYALGYSTVFEPGLVVRHLLTSVQRDRIRRHQQNARNELWSVWMRCPLPAAFAVSLFRISRQFQYAWSEGPGWALQEPIWWLSALKGIRECLRRRKPIAWKIYYEWMKLSRYPVPLP